MAMDAPEENCLYCGGHGTVEEPDETGSPAGGPTSRIVEPSVENVPCPECAAPSGESVELSKELQAAMVWLEEASEGVGESRSCEDPPEILTGHIATQSAARDAVVAALGEMKPDKAYTMSGEDLDEIGHACRLVADLSRDGETGERIRGLISDLTYRLANTLPRPSTGGRVETDIHKLIEALEEASYELGVSEDDVAPEGWDNHEDWLNSLATYRNKCRSSLLAVLASTGEERKPDGWVSLTDSGRPAWSTFHEDEDHDYRGTYYDNPRVPVHLGHPQKAEDGDSERLCSDVAAGAECAHDPMCLPVPPEATDTGGGE